MNIKKVNLIIGREFLIRVRKKSFLVTTFLTPLLMAALIAVPTLMATLKDDNLKKIEVIDPSGLAQRVLANQENTEFIFTDNTDIESFRQGFDESGLHAICVVDTLGNHNVDIRMYSTSPIDIDVQNYISRQIEKEVERVKLESYKIPQLEEIMQDVATKIPVKVLKWTEEGDEKETINEVYMALAYLSSFLIYMFIFMYGSMVIRGVIEEKTNRIVEVIVSSVKPVELMLGKIIGVALVALLQFFLWILLTIVILVVVTLLLGVDGISGILSSGDGITGTIATFDTGNGVLTGIAATLSQINFVQFLLSFCLFFVGGYLMYASMFAAVGSVSDAETDTQQFQLPITIPLILGLFIMMHTFQHPDSTLSVWASMIPFTSPMVMLARLPFGVVPLWQLILSLVLLFATFLAVVYFSAKIYRVGILLYGKKVTWAELWKWMRYKHN